MNPIKESVKSFARLLNQHKEGIKDSMGIVSIIFGAIVLYDGYQRSKIASSTTQSQSATSTSWTERADKVILFTARVSFILSAATSRYGVVFISKLVNTLFSSAQLARVFGSNVNFVGNPWHPRHVCSIGAVVLALPFLLQSMYRGIASCIASKTTTPTARPIGSQGTTVWTLGTTLMAAMLFINVLFSRCILHLGNAFYRTYLR